MNLLLTNRQVAKPLQTNYQLILNYQKLKYPGWHNQEDFLVDVLAHY